MDNCIKIITTVYNARKYISRCLSFIRSQSYSNWKAMIIDDCSTDDTWDIINEHVGSDARFELIRNQKNKKALKNYVECIPRLCTSDEDVIVSLDGDDWFYSNDVLEHVNALYQDKSLWLTYGQYVCASDLERGKVVPGCSKQLESLSDVRKRGVNFSHLKTWKFHLWKRIKDEDLRIDGEYVQRAWDIPMMAPMIECAGLDRIKFVNKIMYVYNNLNPINEYKLDESHQMREDAIIRSREPYHVVP